MSPAFLKTTFLTAATVIGLTACSNMSGDNGPVFGDAGAQGSSIARASQMTTAESMSTGVSAGAMIGATALVIAKHEATPQQRQVAIKRAHAVVARMRVERAQASHGKMAAKKAAKLPRYIAVDTTRNEQTSPRAQKAVMIWDTQSEEVVGHNVYDVQTAPPVGSTARFETYSAEYVGSGI